MTFLKDYFSKNPQGKFRFTGSDTPESELDIFDMAADKKRINEKRPALITQRGPMSWGRIGLDQLRSLNMSTGREVHSDLMSGTMTIHCISREGLEAERLSWEVLFALKSFRKELQRRGLFDAGQDAQLGAESPPGAIFGSDVDAHTVDVPVYSPFYIQLTWTMEHAVKRPINKLLIKTTAVNRATGKGVVDLDGVDQQVNVD